MAKDANFSQVSLLLHCDGANGSTAVVDSSLNAHVTTAGGNTAISTTKSKFGGASLFTGSTTGSMLTVPASAAFDFGTGDMTIEMFLASTTVGDYTTVISRDYTANGWVILSGATQLGGLAVWTQSTGMLMANNTTLSTDGNWHHLAWTRQGNTHRLFLDGAQVATATSAVSLGASGKPLIIGDDAVQGPRRTNGHIDELRITKGLARYTANFTPPSEPFPVGVTVLGVVRDASGNPAARLVRALREDTGAFVGSATSNAMSGAYSIPAFLDTAHTVIAYPAGGESLPALVLRGVIPA